MGTYNDSIVEVYSIEEKAWQLEGSEVRFPVRECDQEFLGITVTDRPFNYQSYAIASFIAGIRNDYGIEPIAPNRGLPEGHESVEEEGWFGYKEMVTHYPYYITDENCTNTWVLLSELLDFDYEQTFESLRSNGENQVITFREHLGEFYFKELECLKKVGQPELVRIVFAFS